MKSRRRRPAFGKPPRNLFLLQCDDSADPEDPESATAATHGANAPPRGVELIRFPGCTMTRKGTRLRAITGWTTAMEYWISVRPDRQPDLITGDVLFESDGSSPLNWGYRDTRIPTGLSHLKPFAAVSRLSGRPLGIAIHTGNPKVWGDLEQHDDTHRIALMAAHEIGELAAILGDARLVRNVLTTLETGKRKKPDEGKQPDASEQKAEDRRTLLSRLWRWLKRESKGTFAAAVARALVDYRMSMIVRSRGSKRRPPTVLVAPADWAVLYTWCDEMRKNPVPLCENDIGLPFYTWDGRRDCVALSSIFADADDLNDTALPSKCFEMPLQRSEEIELACNLDEDRRPRIGAFLFELGSTGTAYVAAVEVLKAFVASCPKGEKSPATLASIVPKSSNAKFVSGLVVLFQWVRAEHENRRIWRELYDSVEWDPTNMTFDAGDKPLAYWLDRLRNLASDKGEPFCREDLLEGRSLGSIRGPIDPNAGWVIWHLERLVDRGDLTLDATTRLYAYRRKVNGPPPLPPKLPKGADWVGKHPKDYLRDSLGIGNGANGLGRVLEYAFWLEDAKAGRAFLNRFLKGDAPPLVVELCREYARKELSWTDEQTWPLCLCPDR